MYKRKPILQGNSDIDQMHKIFGLCGPPTAKSMPGAERLPGFEMIKNVTYQRNLEGQHSRMGSSGVALLSELLKLDPAKRINAIDALKHEYFRVDPQPLKPGEVPKFNDSHELDGKKNRNRGPPPAPAGGSVGVGQTGGPEWAGRAGEVGPWGSGGAVGVGSRRPDWGSGSGASRLPLPPSHGRATHERMPLRDERGLLPHDVSRVPLVNRERGNGGDHRPPWAKTANPPDHPHPREVTLPHRDVGLPLPPPPPRSLTGPPDRDRDRRGRNRGGGGGGGGPDRDTYIPSYGADDDRRGGGGRGWDRDRGVSRDRDRVDRDRGDRADWRDRGPPERGERLERGYGGGPHPHPHPHRSQSRDRELSAHNIYRR